MSEGGTIIDLSDKCEYVLFGDNYFEQKQNLNYIMEL